MHDDRIEPPTPTPAPHLFSLPAFTFLMISHIPEANCTFYHLYWGLGILLLIKWPPSLLFQTIWILHVVKVSVFSNSTECSGSKCICFPTSELIKQIVFVRLFPDRIWVCVWWHFDAFPFSLGYSYNVDRYVDHWWQLIYCARLHERRNPQVIISKTYSVAMKL